MGIIIRKNPNIQENRKIRQNVKNIDLVHGTLSEQEGADVGVEEYSGYHRNTIQSYMNGVYGSPYSRQMDAKTGALKSCGINFYDRLIQRHEMLIHSTGEPVHLLRRKWTGELCPCFDKQRLRADGRCPICFGVGYVGGYVGFVNPKEPDGRIWIRIYPNTEDLPSQEQGLVQENQITAWALPTPIFRDRDVVIRYDPHTGEESWRYVVLNVQRNMGLFNTHTAQVVTISRVDKTHPLNNVRVVDLLNNQVGGLVGKGDELQDLIESESGDGYNDGGFSRGYFSGYDTGYHDAFYQKPFRSIPDDNQDGWIDHPFDNNRRPGDATEFWLVGYREGYKDGFDDGDNQRMIVNPPQRLEHFEKRRVDIASDTLGHSDPRVSPPSQVSPSDYSHGTSGVNPLAEPGNPYPEPGTQMPPPGTCP